MNIKEIRFEQKPWISMVEVLRHRPTYTPFKMNRHYQWHIPVTICYTDQSIWQGECYIYDDEFSITEHEIITRLVFDWVGGYFVMNIADCMASFYTSSHLTPLTVVLPDGFLPNVPEAFNNQTCEIINRENLIILSLTNTTSTN
jgi:hypothetical protein